MDQGNPSRRKPGAAKAAASAPASDKPESSAVSAAPASDLNGISFEQAMTELEGLVAKLDAGDLPLDEALSAYQRGAALMRHAQGILDHVQSQIEVIESGQVRSVDRASLIAQVKE